MVKGNVDDYIRSTGHLAFVNLFLKYALFITGLVCLGLVAALVLVSRHAGEVKAIPIVINEATGESRPIDWKVVDAAGEVRRPVEVTYFIRQLLRNLFTFTKYTAASNLGEAFRACVPDAAGQIRQALDLTERQHLLDRGDQGLVDIQAVNIQQTSPNILVQAFYTERLIPALGEPAERRRVASIRLKTVPRSETNPNGLVVIEYSQSEFKE